MVLVDARGLRVAIDTAAGGPHESNLAQRLFDFTLTRQTPERVIGDQANDTDQLDEQLAGHGIELIAPHRVNRKPENATQDRRLFQRNKRRWTVERAIAWIQNFRRRCKRWEKPNDALLRMLAAALFDFATEDGFGIAFQAGSRSF